MIPTAEVVLEYLIPNAKNEMTGLQYTNALEAIRSHGKHYVEAALKAAAKQAKTILVEDECPLTAQEFETREIDKESILNSYPLTNIK